MSLNLKTVFLLWRVIGGSPPFSSRTPHSDANRERKRLCVRNALRLVFPATTRQEFRFLLDLKSRKLTADPELLQRETAGVSGWSYGPATGTPEDIP